MSQPPETHRPPPAPKVDPNALVLADLAYLERQATAGSQADCTEAAVRAYLWAVMGRTENEHLGTVYPSLDDLRTEMSTWTS